MELYVGWSIVRANNHLNDPKMSNRAPVCAVRSGHAAWIEPFSGCCTPARKFYLTVAIEHLFGIFVATDP